MTSTIKHSEKGKNMNKIVASMIEKGWGEREMSTSSTDDF
jgi:hypothetical protein